MIFAASLAALLLATTMFALWEYHSISRCGVREVRTGCHRKLLPVAAANGNRVAEVLREAVASAAPVASVPLQRRPSQQAEPYPHRPAGTPTRYDGSAAWAVPAGLAAGAGVADMLHVDTAVLEAFAQLTGEEIRHGLDLWNVLQNRPKPYALDHAMFEVKIRGHMGEQEVYEQLRGWAGSQLSVPDASNHPASDLSLGDHDFNVKVGGDASAISEHLREHPDIPVIVNSDMEGLPDDAPHVDLTQPLDPELLADHSVIVADGLMLSDLQDSLADALGPALDSYDGGDLLASAGDLGFQSWVRPSVSCDPAYARAASSSTTVTAVAR